MKDGGPAYPVNWNNGDRDGNDSPGMSLRDHFAGVALAGVLAGNHPVTRDAHCEVRCADAAYALADAMLRARGK